MRKSERKPGKKVRDGDIPDTSWATNSYLSDMKPWESRATKGPRESATLLARLVDFLPSVIEERDLDIITFRSSLHDSSCSIANP